MNKKHQKGTSSELAAAKYLSDKGYYVFFRLSVTSPVDLVAIHSKRKEVLLIDVKSVSLRLSGKYKGTRINRRTTPEQKKLGVKILYHYGNNKFELY
nr:hypothetical protein [uncultured Mediterranean phage uvMED]BAR17952.1 hypothetical protein [uncultured Mediterranean phage uvMED]